MGAVKMIAIQERLNRFPMSFFNRGDIRFLDQQLRRVRISCSISEDALVRARAIELSCIDKAEESAGLSKNLEDLLKELKASRTRRSSRSRKA